MIFPISQEYFVDGLMIASLTVSAEINLQPFVSGSFSQILKQHQGKKFALIFWSIDCPSCYKELEMLSDVIKNNDELDIVLVSTDIEEDESDVKNVLEKYQLEKIQLWLFSSDSSEQLRYEIDKHWYGELPRSYIYHGLEKKQAISGVLTKEKLIKFIKN